MLLATFIFRHICRHWGMNLAVLFGLTLGSALLGSLPSFSAMTAAKSLDASIVNAHPSERNILIESLPSVFTSAINGFINESLGDLVSERISVGSIQLTAHPSAPIISNQEELNPQLNNIMVWSFDKLSQHSSLQSGAWPVVTYPLTQAEALKPPTIQAVITEDVARELDLEIGDQLQDINDFKFLITGIIRVSNIDEDAWWQDIYPFYVIKEPGLNEDTVVVPILIQPKSMQENLPTYHNEWRFILDTRIIDIQNVELIESDLINLKNRISANRVKLTTGLINLLQEYRQNLSISRMVLYLLSSQAFLFVVFTLILMASLLVNSSNNEIVIMMGRGASKFQIIFAFAIQILILALIAGLLLGPLLARLGITFWGLISGDSIPEHLPQETWRLSLIAAGIGWLAIVTGIISATRSRILEWEKSITRPERATGWQKSYMDIFLLVFGILLFWQLSTSGSFVMTRLQGTRFADPLLLIGPSVLLIALALIYMRLFPIMIRSIASIIKTSRGLVLPLGFTRIARNP